MNNRIFAICCALFLAQAVVIQAKPEPNNDLQTAELRGITDAVEKAYKALMAAIDEALEKATNVLHTAEDAVNITVTDLEKQANDAIDKAMEPINAKLKELIEDAEKMGINTTKCEKYVDELTALPKNLNDALVECMTDELYKATDIVDDVLANLQSIEQEMANYTTKIKECEGSILSEITCLGLLTAEIAKDTVEVPLKIGADVLKAKLLIDSLIPKVTLCYTKSLAQVPIQGLALVAKFAVCTGQA